MFIVAQGMSSSEWLSSAARSELGSDLDCNVINSRSKLGSDLHCYELNSFCYSRYAFIFAPGSKLYNIPVYYFAGLLLFSLIIFPA